MANKRIIGRFGDADPITHGGGIVYRQDGYYYLEYSPGAGQGTDSLGDPLPDHICTVWQIRLEKEIPSWVEKTRVDSFTGRKKTKAEMLEARKTELLCNANEVTLSQFDDDFDWLEWAMVFEDIGSYHGWNRWALQSMYTRSSLTKRWCLYY